MYVNIVLILHNRQTTLNTDWLIVIGFQKLHLDSWCHLKEYNAVIIYFMNYKYPQTNE